MSVSTVNIDTELTQNVGGCKVISIWQTRSSHLYNIQKQVHYERASYGTRSGATVTSTSAQGTKDQHESGQHNECGLPERLEHVLWFMEGQESS